MSKLTTIEAFFKVISETAQALDLEYVANNDTILLVDKSEGFRYENEEIIALNVYGAVKIKFRVGIVQQASENGFNVKIPKHVRQKIEQTMRKKHLEHEYIDVRDEYIATSETNDENEGNVIKFPKGGEND